jgi:hypothetical protein
MVRYVTAKRNLEPHHACQWMLNCIGYLAFNESCMAPISEFTNQNACKFNVYIYIYVRNKKRENPGPKIFTPNSL